jgi:hypothetical protein
LLRRSLFIGTSALDRLTLGCALLFRCLPALVGTLLFSRCTSAFLFSDSTLLLHACAFLCLLLRSYPLLRRPCLFLSLPLLGGPGGLFLRLAPLLSRAFLSLALLGGCCCLLLCSALLLRRPLLLSCPTSLRLICTCRGGRCLWRSRSRTLRRRRRSGLRWTGALRSGSRPSGWSAASTTLFATLRTLRRNKRRRSQ